jgi:ABC-type sulfate transport system permease component
MTGETILLLFNPLTLAVALGATVVVFGTIIGWVLNRFDGK